MRQTINKRWILKLLIRKPLEVISKTGVGAGVQDPLGRVEPVEDEGVEEDWLCTVGAVSWADDILGLS